MNAGEIGTAAGRAFSYNIPTNWIIRDQEDQNDHGIDYEIEVKNESGIALGRESVFKVQLKGEFESTFIKNGTFLSYNLLTTKLKYYLDFNIPVILIVVEVSTESIFWLPITNCEDLIEKLDAAISSNQSSVQVHIPVDCKIKKNEKASFSELLNSVNSCWSYLSIRGLRNAVDRYHNLKPQQINKIIDDLGDSLYKAYHQQLHNFLVAKNYQLLYETAGKIANSEIVPAKDKFVALLYYSHSFNTVPHTSNIREEVLEQIKIHNYLLHLAKEDRLIVHRQIAVSKTRCIALKYQTNQLFTASSLSKTASKTTFGHLVLMDTTDSIYRQCCKMLEKIIHLFNRIIVAGQLHILTNQFLSIIVPVILFRKIHQERGSKESISFLDDWFEQAFELSLSYSCISNDYIQAEHLYMLNIDINDNKRTSYKKLIIDTFPGKETEISAIDNKRPNLNSDTDFYSASIEEQKKFYISSAKSLHMDPDDPQSELGAIVSRALKNYDPSEILKNCEHLFVHYRGGGVVAEGLQLHSAGGLHLLICLKHGYAAGTGNLLSSLYDNPNGPEFLDGFKQNHCDKCDDCKPRVESWEWSLKWHHEQTQINLPLLKKYRF